MKPYIAVFAISVVLVLTNSVEVLAQRASSEGRPKIGLVLAGGGAKGAAHVGVIKVLEELGVPIDYIAGTSMGAIVGGLYASGLSADQLANAIRSIDWNDVFDDKPARENRDFRRKLDDEGFLTRYKFGFKDGNFQFPRGVIDGQKLNLVLRSLAIKAVAIQDFDKLPIPFRAVAADIETGETVIIGSGDLATAMRASMAVSGVFPPVELEGRLLVDGGLADNLPMDIARQMGAEARQLGNWGAISLGLDFGYGWKDLNVGSSSLQDDEFGIGEFFGRLNIDTLDNLHFPNSGAKAKVEFRRSTEALGGEETFNNVTSQLLAVRTWDRDTILIGGGVGITFDGDAPTQNLFELGGLFNLSGFQADELSGQNFALGRLIAYRNIVAQSGLFGVPVYIGASLEAGNVWNDRSDMGFDDLIVAGSVFTGADTPLGPVYLAYGHAEGGNDSIYLFLGQTF